MNEKTSSATAIAVDQTEKAILSAVLGGGRVVLQEVLQGGLDPDDFATPTNRVLFSTLCDLLDDGRGLDVLGVVDALEESGDLEAAGGRYGVSQIEAMIADRYAVGRHVERVRERAGKRRLVTAARWIIDEALTSDATAEVLKTQALDLVGNVFAAEVAHTVDRGVVLQSIVADLANPQARRGISTGWADLDAKLGPLAPSDLVILAARPAMGKTALALNLATQVAGQGFNVGVLSHEMDADALLRRCISAVSRVPMPPGKLHFAPDEMREIHTAAGFINDLSLAIDERGGLNIDQVLASIAKLVADGAELIIIDYLGLILPSRNASKNQSKADSVGDISGALKACAKKHKIPIVLLCQLNRGVESRNDKRPMMSDLRDSGAIEQDADKALFLYREEYYLRDKCPTEFVGLAEVIIGKNRTGPTGVVLLEYHEEISLFESRGSS